MKNVFLKKLHLHQFKGVKNLEIDFKNQTTNIYGENGSGKTTIFDAFTWLLFGKDSSDKKDFNIKTINADGSNLSKVEHTVSGELSIDGTIYSLKKIYKENWVKKRGELEAELKGHTTDFYINDVPKQAGEYAKEINDLIDESIFKLITNPKYFADLPWKDQREILFKIAGTISDEEIASGNKEFTVLLEKLSGKKLQDYKLQISNTKKKLKEDFNQIPTRIDELEKSKPKVQNWAALTKEKAEKNAEISSIDHQLENASSAQNPIHESNKKINAEINKLESQQQKIVFDKNQKLNQKDFNIKSEKQGVKNEISTKKNEVVAIEKNNELLAKQKSDLEESLDPLRTKWETENKKVYQAIEGGLNCPLWNIPCGYQKSLDLNAENQEKAKENFNKSKLEILNTINEEGQGIHTKIAEISKTISENDEKINKINSEITELEKKLALYPSDDLKPRDLSPQSIPEWNEIQRKITDLQSGLKEVSAENNQELKSKKSELISEVESITKILAQKESIERIDARKLELETESKNLSQQISDLEKDEFTIDALTKAKIDESESRINGMFKFVKFRLFENQINGAEVETCKILVNGVPYADVNTASKINAGIDIINVLSKFNGITAPVFIDNRESVTNILETEAQIINLIVSTDKTLTIK